MSYPRYEIQHGPCGDSIERVDDSFEGLVICPTCSSDVREETIRDGRCTECPEEYNGPLCERCHEPNETTHPDMQQQNVVWSYCVECKHWTEHSE